VRRTAGVDGDRRSATARLTATGVAALTRGGNPTGCRGGKSSEILLLDSAPICSSSLKISNSTWGHLPLRIVLTLPENDRHLIFSELASLGKAGDRLICSCRQWQGDQESPQEISASWLQANVQAACQAKEISKLLYMSIDLWTLRGFFVGRRWTQAQGCVSLSERSGVRSHHGRNSHAT
jgi:hypothetical protein